MATDNVVPMPGTQQPRTAKGQAHLLPQNVEAEAALIGAALIFGDVPEQVADVLPRHFYQEAHRLIWQALSDLREQGEPADLITVNDLLAQRGQLDGAGGNSYLSSLTINVPSSRNVKSYARIVKRTARARQAISFASDLAAAGYGNDDDGLWAYWAGMRETLDEELADIAAGRFQLLSIGDVRMRERPQWLIPGMLQERKQWLVFGDSNAGKSFFALDLALSLATGEAWLGHRPAKVGHVVYVCAEGADGVRDRIDAWLLHHGLDDAPNLHIITESPNLLDAGDVAGVIAQIKTLDGLPLVTVFDTLAASMEGGDENSPEDMTAAVGALRRVQRECECAVLTVHHSGKDATRGARGHSSLRAAMDTQIEIAKDEDSGIISAKCRKARDAGYFAPMALRLHPIALDEYADVTSCVIVPTSEPLPRPKPKKRTAPDKLLDVIASFGMQGGTHAELKTAFQKATGMSASSFDKAHAELVELGRLEYVNECWRVLKEER